MRKQLFFLFAPFILFLNTCSQKEHDQLLFVRGGVFTNPNSNFYGRNISISDFYIGKYEVTQKEWMEVMEDNPSKFKGDNLPVEMVSWYDCIEYCNQRSIKEGLIPYYNIDKYHVDKDNENPLDSLKWTVTINPEANGYRLPTEAEWEYAASGGQLSKGYLYSGSNDINRVAWYWRNSGDKFLTGFWFWRDIENNHNCTKFVGLKIPNELGLYDMSGNIREWCWNWCEGNDIEPKGRVWKGGGWIGAEFCCEISFRGSFEPSGKGPDQGFRVCRDKKP